MGLRCSGLVENVESRRHDVLMKIRNLKLQERENSDSERQGRFQKNTGWRRASLALAGLMVLLLLFGGGKEALAYWKSQVRVSGQLKLQLKTSSPELLRSFDEEGREQITVKNSSDIPVYVRVTLSGEEIKVQEAVSWRQDPEDGAYYYQEVLKAGESASPLTLEVSLQGEEEEDILIQAEAASYLYDGENGADYPAWQQEKAGNSPEEEGENE